MPPAGARPAVTARARARGRRTQSQAGGGRYAARARGRRTQSQAGGRRAQGRAAAQSQARGQVCGAGAGAGSADADREGDPAPAGSGPADVDREGDPALVSTTGTVDGGTFRFRAAHFEWLLRFGAALGLGFADMGQRRHGDAATLFFCDELFRLYGSSDYNEAMGASFAVENWAAAGFWKELIRGLERVKAEQVPALPLAFFTWHDRLEENHREHVWHELRACYDSPAFEEEAFIAAGIEMLDAVGAFWGGLYDARPRDTGEGLAATA